MVDYRWIIQDDVFNDADIDRLTAALDAAKIGWRRFTKTEFMTNLWSDTDAEDFIYGSTHLWNLLPRVGRPQFWFDDRYTFSNLTAHLNSAMLNDRYHLVPAQQLCDRLAADRFAWCHHFMKPNGAVKTWSGVALGALPEAAQADCVKAMAPESLVVVAPVKGAIYHEYRCWCTADRVLVSTCYHDSQHRWTKPTLPVIEQWLTAQLRLVPFYHPIMVVDVALVPNREAAGDNLMPKIIEVNAFSTSGGYTVDWGKILPEWRRLYERSLADGEAEAHGEAIDHKEVLASWIVTQSTNWLKS